jgi:endoglycosylceramidase
MRRRLLLLAALAVLLAALPAGASAVVRGPFHPDGRWLKDAQGRVVIVHGLQIAHKTRPYHPSARQLNAADAHTLRSLGFNSVRLAWMWSGLEPKRGHTSTAYAREIARETRLFTHEGVAVLLEAHQDVFSAKTRGVGFPSWAAYTAGKPVGPKRTKINYRYPGVERAFASLFRNKAGTARAFARAWGVMARAVASEQAMLLGYDLFNEPWPGRAAKDCDDGCRIFDHGFLGPLQSRLARAIRAHDRRSVVWYEPHLLFDFGAPSYLRRAPADVAPAGFTFHAYCRRATGGYGARPNQESTSPFYKTCAGEDRRVFSHAEHTAKSLGGPPLFGEFGDSTDRRHLERMMNAADRNRTGWLFWSYKDWTDVPGGLGDGSLFDNDNDTSSLRGGQADVLSRAYPEAVAGEPLRWSWSRTARRFELVYRPDASIHAPTLVSVPVQRQYPGGYRVEVAGGTVLSAPDAASLALVPLPGAKEVRVTVVPR